MSGYTIECTGETDWMEAHIDVEPMAGDGWNEPRAGGGVTCEAIRFRLDKNRYTRWFNPGEMPDDLPRMHTMPMLRVHTRRPLRSQLGTNEWKGGGYDA